MRRPPALELQVPAEPAVLWAARGLQGLALAVWTHWALAWGVVEWELHVPAWGLAAAALFAGCVFLAFSRRAPATHTQLHFDGEQWHWTGAHDVSPRGSGTLQVAFRFGPWWLLRARARRGNGRGAWIWLRPEAVRSSASPHAPSIPGLCAVDGIRLRTLLNWS